MNPESKNKSPDKLPHRLTDLLFYSVMFVFIVALAFPHNPAGNWYQQFLPFPTGGQVRDIYFVDSLTGFAVSDSSILKTTNSGDNWTVKQTGYYIFNRIIFLNANTGFASGGNNTLLKTINSGENWTPISLPSIFPFDMSVVSEDSIWLVNTNGLTGGVYFTFNGGANWQNQLNIGSQNPEKIYMFNSRIGYISRNMGSSGYVRKTTNGGMNWNLIVNNDYYLKINFADSLTGWKSSAFGFKKTTDGGLNWITQTVPSGGIIQSGFIGSFYVFNKDTLFGTGGGVMYPNNEFRGIIYRTTNGGDTWKFQVPDTSIHISGYTSIQFVNKRNGWLYNYVTGTGIHTINGGDTTFLLPVNQVGSEVPKQFSLFQNYPNPFNPATNIKYQISKTGKSKTAKVKIIIYDITGRETVILVNEEQSAGTYQADWNASGFSSGVYFYSLIIEGKIIDTKRMVLIK
jgi:photosystem II stability/assembly factor-like uncharacterized protein